MRRLKPDNGWAYAIRPYSAHPLPGGFNRRLPDRVHFRGGNVRHQEEDARVETEVRTGTALERAVRWLIERQDVAGWWCGELETNVTMTAEHILLLRFLGLDTEPIRDAALRHILLNRSEDGSWALYFGGPADLSTTIEAYVALKALDVDPGIPLM